VDPLGRFHDEPIAGTWTLKARDIGGANSVTNPTVNPTGSIVKWTLSITPLDCTTTPTARTDGADGVSQTAATLHGNVDPRGTATQYRFEYGITTGYGTNTTTVDTGTSAVDSSAPAAGLSPSTTYHYRVVALRGGSPAAAGADRTFTTSAATPTITPPTVTPVAGFSFKKSPRTLTLDSKGQFTWSFAALKGLKGKAVFSIKVKKKTVKLATKTFTVAQNGTAKIKVKLSKANFKLIKKLKKAKVSVALSSTSPVKAKASSSLTLKAPKKKK
jgi:hypothetical protein